MSVLAGLRTTIAPRRERTSSLRVGLCVRLGLPERFSVIAFVARRLMVGYSHGVLMVNEFYENVSRARMEDRELAPGEKDENVVLEFKPKPSHDMLVARLWSRWSAPGEPHLLVSIRMHRIWRRCDT